MKLGDLGEFGFITRHARQLQRRRGVTVGIGDDAAVLSALETPVVTCDALIENVHFRRDWTTPFFLGRKAMNVSVSDLAAKGARPVAAFVSLGLSSTLALEEDAVGWLDELYRGFEDAAGSFDFTLAGGDTVRTQSEIMISVTLVGEVEPGAGKCGAPVLRSGARHGDMLLVTGSLGDAAAALFLLQHPEVKVGAQAREYLLCRHLNPVPRLAEMKLALESSASTRAISASLDLSDGLAGDAAHIAEQSQLRLEIDVESLPISAACREAVEAARNCGYDVCAMSWALSGGEDYELLWCVPPEMVASVSQAVAGRSSTLVTEIGRCRESEGAAKVQLLRRDGSEFETPGAWLHF